MRTRYVTRRITTIVATCNIYNSDTKEITEEKIVLSSKVSENKLDKEISKIISPNKRLLEVVTTETVKAYYRMTESDFIEHATIVPQKENVNE